MYFFKRYLANHAIFLEEKDKYYQKHSNKNIKINSLFEQEIKIAYFTWNDQIP